MARKLEISEGAVKYHVHQLMRKFRVNRRRQAIAEAPRLGYLKENDLPPAA